MHYELDFQVDSVRATSDTVMPVQQPVFGGHWSLDDFLMLERDTVLKESERLPQFVPSCLSVSTATNIVPERKGV